MDLGNRLSIIYLLKIVIVTSLLFFTNNTLIQFCFIYVFFSTHFSYKLGWVQPKPGRVQTEPGWENTKQGWVSHSVHHRYRLTYVFLFCSRGGVSLRWCWRWWSECCACGAAWATQTQKRSGYMTTCFPTTIASSGPLATILIDSLSRWDLGLVSSSTLWVPFILL